MNSRSQQAGNATVRDYCALALMGALMFVLKLALASLPNVHLCALLIIICAVFFGWRCIYSVAIYVLLEGLYFGFSIWWISYLYAWPLLAAVAVCMRRNDSPFVWAAVGAVHGLCFGALCAIPYLFIGGWSAALAYWVAGIPYDLLHCAGNFVIIIALYKPLCKAIKLALRR